MKDGKLKIIDKMKQDYINVLTCCNCSVFMIKDCPLHYLHFVKTMSKSTIDVSQFLSDSISTLPEIQEG